jgi:hypothetical protein
MGTWRAFRRLAPQRRRLVLEATAFHLLARLSMLWYPGAGLRRLARLWQAAADRTGLRPADHDDVAWAVAAAAARLPFATTCLIDALVADAMLRRRHHSPELRFGVRRPEPSSPLTAHAWVDCEGVLVVGRVDDLDTYATLTAGSAR